MQPIASETYTERQPAARTTRERILHIVRERPGTTNVRIAQMIGRTQPTVSYHLNALRQAGLIERERSGREVRHYPTEYATRAMRLNALLRDDRRAKVARFLSSVEDKNLESINKLVHELDIPYGFVHRTLVRLEDLGLVDIQREADRNRILISDSLQTLLRRTTEGTPSAGQHQ